MKIHESSTSAASPRSRRPLILLLGLAVALALIYTLWLSAAGTNTDLYVETFDEAGTWMVGQDANATAAVTNGQYEIEIDNPVGVFLGTNGEVFADGVYEVSATQLAGPLDNGYGMVLRANPDDTTFYMFEISGDGFIWAGYCVETCDNQGWQPAGAVNQGIDAPNQLRVEAMGSQFTFYVNDTQVAQFEDDNLARGEIGVLVETFGGGGVKVAFDDFTVTPLE